MGEDITHDKNLLCLICKRLFFFVLMFLYFLLFIYFICISCYWLVAPRLILTVYLSAMDREEIRKEFTMKKYDNYMRSWRGIHYWEGTAMIANDEKYKTLISWFDDKLNLATDTTAYMAFNENRLETWRCCILFARIYHAWIWWYYCECKCPLFLLMMLHSFLVFTISFIVRILY